MSNTLINRSSAWSRWSLVCWTLKYFFSKFFGFLLPALLSQFFFYLSASTRMAEGQNQRRRATHSQSSDQEAGWIVLTTMMSLITFLSPYPLPSLLPRKHKDNTQRCPPCTRYIWHCHRLFLALTFAIDWNSQKKPLNKPPKSKILKTKNRSVRKCVGNALRDSVATGIRAISDSALHIRSLSLYLFIHSSFSLFFWTDTHSWFEHEFDSLALVVY